MKLSVRRVIFLFVAASVTVAVTMLAVTMDFLSFQSRPVAIHAFTESGGVLVIAHRGGRGLWPENTLFAFEKAVKLGVDVLEFDVHLTRDHQLVIIHDSTLERTTDGIGRVEEKDFSDLSLLDAGYRWTDDKGKTYPFRGRGIRLPLLEEVLAAFPTMRMNIELKTQGHAAADRFSDVLRRFGCGDRVLAASFNADTIDRVRAGYPQLAFTAATRQAASFLILNLLRLDFIFNPTANAFQVPPKIGPLPVVTPYFVQQAHRQNVVVHAWTINEKDEMIRLLKDGVDGILTDYPDRLLVALGRTVPEN